MSIMKCGSLIRYGFKAFHKLLRAKYSGFLHLLQIQNRSFFQERFNPFNRHGHSLCPWRRLCHAHNAVRKRVPPLVSRLQDKVYETCSKTCQQLFTELLDIKKKLCNVQHNHTWATTYQHPFCWVTLFSWSHHLVTESPCSASRLLSCRTRTRTLWMP